MGTCVLSGITEGIWRMFLSVRDEVVQWKCSEEGFFFF